MQAVYLTGPDIRIPHATALYKIKQDLLAKHNMRGLCSLDVEISDTTEKALKFQIFAKNLKLIEEADMVCANLTPFRGVSADTSTVWELGYAYSKRKPIYAYAATDQTYVERVQKEWTLQRHGSGVLCDGLGYLVEDFEGVDSLMLDACVVGTIVTGPWIGDLSALAEFRKLCQRMQFYR